MELVLGTTSRSGGTWDIYNAVYSPVGDDGYPMPIWDKMTGVINHEVAEHWKENYDLLHYLQRNWARVGPKLVGKLHIYTGDMDTYYLNNAVRKLEEWMKTTTDPHYEGFFMYGDRKPHCWSGPVTAEERLTEMAQFILREKPEDLTTPWWNYRP